MGVACHKKNQTPIFSPPGPNVSKYLDPQIIYFKFAKIFGPPETKMSLCPSKALAMPDQQGPSDAPFC